VQDRLPLITFRARRDLDQGEIVSISYIPEYLPTWRRRQLLQEGYGFKCMCDRCEREAETVCAFLCPACGDGPCSPTTPVLAPGGDIQDLVMGCEACGVGISESHVAGPCNEAELADTFTLEATAVLHPFHHKIFNSYYSQLLQMASADRIEAIDQLINAFKRLLPGGSADPLLGKLCEYQAAASLELGEHQQAVTTYRRAQEYYAQSHRGPPDPGHVQRCRLYQVSAARGPLGAMPRRLSQRKSVQMGKSPSLPSLAEGPREAER
jgi:hypothetical protein